MEQVIENPDLFKQILDKLDHIELLASLTNNSLWKAQLSKPEIQDHVRKLIYIDTLEPFVTEFSIFTVLERIIPYLMLLDVEHLEKTKHNLDINRREVEQLIQYLFKFYIRLLDDAITHTHLLYQNFRKALHQEYLIKLDAYQERFKTIFESFIDGEIKDYEYVEGRSSLCKRYRELAEIMHVKKRDFARLHRYNINIVDNTLDFVFNPLEKRYYKQLRDYYLNLEKIKNTQVAKELIRGLNLDQLKFICNIKLVDGTSLLAKMIIYEKEILMLQDYQQARFDELDKIIKSISE